MCVLSHHIAWVGVAQWLVAGRHFALGDPPSGLSRLDWIVETQATCVLGVRTQELRQRVLPRITEGSLGALAIAETTAGADATGMRTRFTAAGDDIVVNGSERFISNADVADFLLAFGKWDNIEDPRAAPRAVPR